MKNFVNVTGEMMNAVNEQGSKSNKWIWTGLGAAALFCLCAVAVALTMFYQVGRRVQQGMKTDPESASQAGHAIADYELPPGYREQAAMDLFVYTFVMIGPESPVRASGPLIMLAQFDPVGADPEEMERQIRQSFEQQAGRRGQNMKVVEARKMTIRGEEVEVVIYEGTDESGVVMRQLLTSFPGREGTAMLMIMGPAANWDQNVIDDFVGSIH